MSDELGSQPHLTCIFLHVHHIQAHFKISTEDIGGEIWSDNALSPTVICSSEYSKLANFILPMNLQMGLK